MEEESSLPPVSLRLKSVVPSTLSDLQRSPDYTATCTPMRSSPRHLILDLDNNAGKGGKREEAGGELGHLHKRHQQRLYQLVAPSLVLYFTDLSYSVKKTQQQAPGLLHFFRRHKVPAFPVAAGSDLGRTAVIAKEKNKTILESVSGEARDGEILAVMGPSGSGKTTLIDALAGRISSDSLSGSVSVNGEALLSGGTGIGLRRRRLLIASISAYVMQDDLLHPMLTVEETLSFAAQLRLPLSARQRRDRVEALLDQLGLSTAAGTIIGDEGHQGVSGGERRRVSIGVGIVHDPLLLFLDEPTTGLDSTSAFMVVKVLRRIAESGSAVTMSIHQPSSRILSLLNRVMLLSSGKVVYYGTTTEIRPFFAAFGRPVPDGENRAEFALDLIRELESSSSTSSCPSSEADSLVEFNISWQQKKQQIDRVNHGGAAVSLKDAISTSMSGRKLVVSAPPLAAPPSSSSLKANMFANPPWVEVLILMRRSFLNSRRQVRQFAIPMGMLLLTAITISTLFRRLSKSPSGVRDRMTVFVIAFCVIFFVSAEALLLFLHERYIFIRETANNAYRRSSFVVAVTLSALPSLVTQAAAFAVATFFTLGLAGGWRGFLFYFLTLLTGFWAASSFVTFLAGVIPKGGEIPGFVAVISAITLFMLLSGFFVTRESIPWYWRWLHYASPVKYSYEAAVQGEMLGGGGDSCFARGGQVFEGSPLETAPEAVKNAVLQGMGQTMGFNITSQTCLATGNDVIRQYGIRQLGKWESVWIAIGWGFLFRGLFYVTLLLGSSHRRR